jgi:hypothetical protein
MALDSRFLRICCRRLESVTIARPSCGSVDVEGELPCDSAWCRKGGDRLQQVCEVDLLGLDGDGAGLDLGQVEDVADQVEEVGAGAVDGAGELDLLGAQVAVGVLGELLAEDEDALSGVRSSWLMLARNSDLYFEVSASSARLLLDGAAGLLDLLVLALDLGVALGELLRPSARAARWSAAARPAGSAARRRAAATAEQASVCIVASMVLSTMPIAL